MALAGFQDGLAIYGSGGGSPALLMPSPECAASADFAVMALAERLGNLGREVVTFDPPQSGRSVRPARPGVEEAITCAEEALAYCGIARPADVIGHGQGGLAALALALERPRLVRGLVLICCAASGGAFLHTPEPLAARFLSRFERDPRRGWRSAARGLDYTARLGEIAAPTLVIAGGRDPRLPRRDAETLASGIRDSRLIVLEEGGHYPFFDEPEAFWNRVSAFLASGRPLARAAGR